MNKAISKVFSHTHYAVSTVAAVLYGIAWLVGNNVRADVANEPAVLSAVVVTAKREALDPIVLDAVVVTAQREQFAMLAPVYVTASRDTNAVSARQTTVASTRTHLQASDDAASRVSVVRKARNWVLAALIK